MAQSDKETQDEKAQLREDMEIHIEDTLYDQDELGPLEDYVDKQVTEEANYDFHSNLYLMKMYSLYPFNAREDIVVKVLIKAMMNLPESDFTSLIYLIPVSLVCVHLKYQCLCRVTAMYCLNCSASKRRR